MNNYCNKCGTCCKLIPIDIDSSLILRDGFQSLDNDFLANLSFLNIEEALLINENYVKKVQYLFPNAKFYKCSYLSDENLCTNLQKPEICSNFPSHPMALIDDECGFCGEIFIKTEEIKQKIRKYKEEILYYESMINAGCKDEKVYKKIIDSLKRFIVKYEIYGAKDW